MFAVAGHVSSLAPPALAGDAFPQPGDGACGGPAAGLLCPDDAALAV
ncbi:MAG: hypothetical protein ABR926_04665 [Streptosporangiaceae bacterium]